MPVLQRCYVPMCESRVTSTQEAEFTLFSVPKNRLRQWRNAVPRGKRLLNLLDKVCAKHFAPEDVIVTPNENFPRLKATAIPKIFQSDNEQSENKYMNNSVGFVKSSTSGRKIVPQKEIDVNAFDDIEHEIETPATLHEMLFKTIWNRVTDVSTPSPSWALHFIEDSAQSKDEKIICICEMVSIPAIQNVLVRKKITISKKSTTYYVFEDEIKHTALKQFITDISELAEILENFDQLNISYEEIFINKKQVNV